MTLFLHKYYLCANTIILTMKPITIIATIIAITIAIPSCKNNNKSDNPAPAATDSSKVLSPSATTGNELASQNSDTAYAMDVEKIFTLIKEVASDWKDEDGLKGQKAGLSLMKQTRGIDGEIELIAFYYGHNVRLVADTPNKFTSPNAMNAPVFTPAGGNAFYILIGADSTHGSIIFFNQKNDYDLFISKVSEYGLYTNDYGYSFIPETKTGKNESMSQSSSLEKNPPMLSFEPMGLQNGWFKIIMGLDI